MEDSNCSAEMALSWAISAKNTLCGHNGYSPNQLVFGKNPSFPNILDNDLPALEEKPFTLTVANNLNVMHKSREAFIKVESSEKIKRALKHNIRTTNDDAPFYFIDNNQGQAVWINADSQGHALIFPGTLIHTVYPKQTEDVRISVSGNVILDVDKT